MTLRPLVILPGYYGSKLNLKSNNKLIWIDLKGILTPKKVMDTICLGPHGEEVYPSKILDKIELTHFFCLNFYKSLKKYLRNTVGYDSDAIFGHAIDWRQSLSFSADRLQAFLDSDPLKNKRVDLLCHSHGGLIARAYLSKHGPSRIARCITLGTPHHGMLKVLEALHDGINLHTFSKGMTKPAAITMPSAYELLPRGIQCQLYSWDGVATDPLQEPAWTDHEPDAKLRAMLKQQVADAKQTTNALLPNDQPVPSYFIYGTRLDTMVHASGSPSQRLHITRDDDGDNTIKRASAMGVSMSGPITRCPAPFASHSDIFNNAYVRRLLKSILREDKLPWGEFQVAVGWDHRRYHKDVPLNLSVEVRDKAGIPLSGVKIHLLINLRGQSRRPIVAKELVQTDRGDYFVQVIFTKKFPALHYRVKLEHPDLPEKLRFHRGTLRAH